MRMGVVVEGFKEFRSALRAAQGSTPRALSKGIKAAGEPLLERARELAPRRSGRLAGSARLRTRATSGDLVFVQPYAAGAEWGQFGKWSGFRKYGPRGNRYAFRALRETGDEIATRMHGEMAEIITVFGWFS